MSTTYHTPLRSKPGARATRVTPRPEPKRQSVTNAEWRARREAQRRANPLARLLAKVLP